MLMSLTTVSAVDIKPDADVFDNSVSGVESVYTAHPCDIYHLYLYERQQPSERHGQRRVHELARAPAATHARAPGTCGHASVRRGFRSESDCRLHSRGADPHPETETQSLALSLGGVP